jgi:DNA-binding NarL/FixJ family response regulator
VTAFILGDVALHRDGLARLLLDEPQVQLVGVAAPGPTALARIGQLLPNIVLLDVSRPARFLEARAIREATPEVKVVAIGVPEAEDEIVCCAEAGVSGYVTPESTVAELAATLASVTRDELHCSPRIAATLMHHVGSLAYRPLLAAPFSQLTRRERDVVELVAQGLANKEIAVALAIEVTTVKTHVHHLLVKLHLRRRSELVALAHHANLDRVAPLVTQM